MASPKITLYTNPNCPWAQRAHITLKELNLPYEQVFIDIEKPREEWYLAINPKGQVPTLSYNGTVITESGIVAQFLADAHPHPLNETGTETQTRAGLLPPSNSFEGAIQRARIAFFVDAWVSKVYPVLTGVILGGESHGASTEGLVGVIEKEIEPLLLVSAASGDADSFFGDSETLTLAEVLTGPFLLWIFTLLKPEYGALSTELISVLRERVPRFASWASRVVAHDSVRHVLDEEWVGNNLKARWEGAVAKKEGESKEKEDE
ncbi:thioredoxin-like protein [Aspergillus pseudoustus]|uniref:Thioredoxin-like protein n=1 Tax=Aspergillus pseudoustus TaxID=1810923 RepID=A0ABR4KXT1_9EURO